MRLTKPTVYRFEFFVALSLFFATQRGEKKGQRGKKNRQGGEKTLRSLGRTGAELRQPLRRGSTKGLGHFSPVAVPANRRLSRKTARELPVCPKNGKAVFPKNMRSLAEFRPLPLARLPSSAPGGGRFAPPSDFSFSAGFLF